MSQVLIQQYLNQLQDLRKGAGTHRESVVREAFKDLLKGWAPAHDLIFVPEYEIATPAKDRRYVDGALVHTLRVAFRLLGSQRRNRRPGRPWRNLHPKRDRALHDRERRLSLRKTLRVQSHRQRRKDPRSRRRNRHVWRCSYLPASELFYPAQTSIQIERLSFFLQVSFK